MLIEILAFEGVDELDALGPLEVLRNAAAAGAGSEVRLVSLNGEAEITGGHGLRFSVDGRLGSERRPDILLIPGGGWAKRAPQGAWAEAQKGKIPAAIADVYRKGSILASVCTGAMLIATAGLLKGRRAITHHGAVGDLRQSGAEVVQARVVDDGDIITSGGVTSGLDLALYLVERFASPELAEQVARNLEYERRGPIHASARAARSLQA
jgi:transcriptional regulator GlxA family with amidase domain